jgi:peptide deformylase
MAILKIARMGHPVLGRVAAPVEDPGAPELRQLVADMLDTMEDAGGTGLAAPQVYVPRRLVIFFVSASRAEREAGAADMDDAEADAEAATEADAGEDTEADAGEDTEADAGEDTGEVPLTVLINPVIEVLTGPGDGEMITGWESCLSAPGLAGQVPRHRAIRYRGIGLDGEEIVREAHGFHARVVQHECDHLDGILYPQRMTDLSALSFTSELGARSHAEAEEAEEPAGTEEAE